MPCADLAVRNCDGAILEERCWDRCRTAKQVSELVVNLARRLTMVNSPVSSLGLGPRGAHCAAESEERRPHQIHTHFPASRTKHSSSRSDAQVSGISTATACVTRRQTCKSGGLAQEKAQIPEKRSSVTSAPHGRKTWTLGASSDARATEGQIFSSGWTRWRLSWGHSAVTGNVTPFRRSPETSPRYGPSCVPEPLTRAGQTKCRHARLDPT